MTDETMQSDAPLTSGRESVRSEAEKGTAEEGYALAGRTFTVDRPREELYAFWRDFSNLPRFMENIEEVRVADETRSHWVVRGPAGESVEWDAIITEDEPGRRFSWESTEGAMIRNRGTVEFLDGPAGRGTWVRATIAYDPPGSALGKWVAKLFQAEPKLQVRRDLRRFKQLMETGEVSTSRPPSAAPRA
ncbi:SRPBCC family protein [Afifella sp. JA880]|uniref:SRPBCC family protein n=1 Tax=Afifella sp. JA880 TaxID=2975280 RepID=UPI0021BAFF85|nr:SRPBCC family protein [Afifella sp. JA880]MCT8266292.1 SRPBCC family protein [Afifella sp. JA880]